MTNFYIPNESDIRRWVKEAVKECLEEAISKSSPPEEKEEPLWSRKKTASFFEISLVTLTDWVKKGLPSHKQRGRRYFLKSEVMEYIKNKEKLS